MKIGDICYFTPHLVGQYRGYRAMMHDFFIVGYTNGHGGEEERSFSISKTSLEAYRSLSLNLLSEKKRRNVVKSLFLLE